MLDAAGPGGYQFALAMIISLVGCRDWNPPAGGLTGGFRPIEPAMWVTGSSIELLCGAKVAV